MTCENNCGFEEMNEEELNLLWHDACIGNILMQFIEALNDSASSEETQAIVDEMLDEVDKMYEETEEVLH
jgi:ribosome assembly protein YihI (activator of Der GTPase)